MYIHVAHYSIVINCSHVLKAAIALKVREVVWNAPLVITVGMVLTIFSLPNVNLGSSVERGSPLVNLALRVRTII